MRTYITGVQSPRFNTRLRRALLGLSIVPWLPECAPRDGAPAPTQSRAVSIEGWQAETFPLPPDFAPDLPTGVESLRFAPGWRDPGAEGFWSYAFVMWIDEPAPDGARIQRLLETYYNGLMAAFAGDKAEAVSAAPARVNVERAGPGRYEARMRLIDAFATFKPIDLRVLIDTAARTNARSTLSIRVSPQPKEHTIWRSLDAAVADILARDGAAHASPDGASQQSSAESAR